MTRKPPPSPLAGEGQPTRSDGRVRGRRALLLKRAKAMRHEPTPAEKALWRLLRDRRLEHYIFRRQVRIDPYIVDFACLERRLIIEADGGQHAESDHDARRDAFLTREGFSVLRFWNNDVLNNPVGVFDAFYAALATPHPPTASQRVQHKVKSAPHFSVHAGGMNDLMLSPARGEGLGDRNA